MRWHLLLRHRPGDRLVADSAAETVKALERLTPSLVASPASGVAAPSGTGAPTEGAAVRSRRVPGGSPTVVSAPETKRGGGYGTARSPSSLTLPSPRRW
jgi:hypothetical protein